MGIINIFAIYLLNSLKINQENISIDNLKSKYICLPGEEIRTTTTNQVKFYRT